MKQSIEDDFQRPIEAAVQGPLSDLRAATYQARDVMKQVRSESRLQTWNWVAVMVILGVVGCHWFFVRGLHGIDDRIDAMQQQVTAAAAPQPCPPPIPPGPSQKKQEGH